MLMVQSHILYFLIHNLKCRLFNIQKPLLAGFKITYRCNLRCKSCPFWKEKPQSISLENAKNIMLKLYEHGVRIIIFEGGEPFLWRDGNYFLENLVIFAKQLFFAVGITTNGLLPLETSADVVWVSIDGLKKSHDANRGKSFDRIIKNIQASTHKKIFANITITNLNHHDIPELVKFLSPIVKGMTFQFYYPFPNSENLWLSDELRIDVLNKLIKLKQQGYPIIDSISTLSALKQNNWRCHSWLIASANPDASINIGCYLKDRAEISCKHCGFAAHTEISKAFDWNIGAINAGIKTFGFKLISHQ